jgi:hypothetical protein
MAGSKQQTKRNLSFANDRQNKMQIEVKTGTNLQF